MPSCAKPSRKLSNSHTTLFEEAKRRFHYEQHRSHKSLIRGRPHQSPQDQHFEHDCSSVRETNNEEHPNDSSWFAKLVSGIKENPKSNKIVRKPLQSINGNVSKQSLKSVKKTPRPRSNSTLTVQSKLHTTPKPNRHQKCLSCNSKSQKSTPAAVKKQPVVVKQTPIFTKPNDDEGNLSEDSQSNEFLTPISPVRRLKTKHNLPLEQVSPLFGKQNKEKTKQVVPFVGSIKKNRANREQQNTDRITEKPSEENKITSRLQITVSKNQDGRSTSRGKPQTAGLRYDYKQQLVKRYKYRVGGLNLQNEDQYSSLATQPKLRLRHSPPTYTAKPTIPYPSQPSIIPAYRQEVPAYRPNLPVYRPEMHPYQTQPPKTVTLPLKQQKYDQLRMKYLPGRSGHTPTVSPQKYDYLQAPSPSPYPQSISPYNHSRSHKALPAIKQPIRPFRDSSKDIIPVIKELTRQLHEERPLKSAAASIYNPAPTESYAVSKPRLPSPTRHLPRKISPDPVLQHSHSLTSIKPEAVKKAAPEPLPALRRARNQQEEEVDPKTTVVIDRLSHKLNSYIQRYNLNSHPR